jgi:hypothetical protein
MNKAERAFADLNREVGRLDARLHARLDAIETANSVAVEDLSDHVACLRAELRWLIKYLRIENRFRDELPQSTLLDPPPVATDEG